MQFSPQRGFLVRLALFSALALLPAWPARAMDEVLLKRDEHTLRVTGRVIVTAEDGGLLVMATDGTLWAVTPEELVKHTKDDRPYRALDAEAIAQQLRQELPASFEVLTTQHYVICYNTSRAYAQWCGALYERLHRAFTNFWTRKGFKLREPEWPLVALIFADQSSYQSFAKRELGDSVGAIVGYYSMATNRVTMYDLTGLEALRQSGAKRSTAADINAMLSQPAAEPMVATIIHEATHQIAFNCGLQTRYADIPLWVSEGLAVYFETPDLGSGKGWRSIGSVNPPRLELFQKNLAGRKAGDIVSMLSDDKRMRDPRTAADAYAEAWALNYYLFKKHPQQYADYLKLLATRRELVPVSTETRLAEFRQFFGEDLSAFDAGFLRFVQQLK